MKPSLGLTTRALAAWAGTDRIAALPERLAALAAPAPVPAATALALFVAGARLPIDRVRGLAVEALLEDGLLVRDGDDVRAPLAIVPHGPALLVCDHHDAADDEHLVAWPDDSSHHLAGSIPRGRRARWLDIGCGSAFAQLARPELAAQLVAVDRNPRAVHCARLGAALSGIAHLEAQVTDVGALAVAPAELVTCNAPLPGVGDRAIWRRAGDGFFPALWRAIRAHVAPGGLAVVHVDTTAIPADLDGERVVVTYAPEIGILWWRPDEPARVVRAQRDLTAERPHLDARDRDDAVAAC